MRTPATRALARMRPSIGPSRLRFSTPSFSTSRSYSSLLRPVALSHTTNPFQTRPTLPLQPPTHSHSHQKSRSFSLLPLLEGGISTAQALLNSMHITTGTPWFLTIPLFALWLNLATRLPTTIYSRRIAVRRELLRPLSLAYGARVRADLDRALKEKLQREKTQTPPGQPLPVPLPGMRTETAHFITEFTKANAAEEKLRNKRWGTQTWKDWVPALSVFPFWLLGIEGLRRMCGGPRGLVGTMVFGQGRYEELKQGGGQGAVVDAAAAKTGEGAAVVVGDGEVVDGQGSGAVEGADWNSLPAEQAEGTEALATSSGQAEVQEALAASLPDPSMTTGGCLWFPDLTVADPHHILPFALSAIMVLNVMPKTQASWRVLLGLHPMPGAVFGAAKWRLRMHRGMLVVAMCVGPVTMDLPAAIHLYWMSSAALTWAQTNLIWRLMPVRKIVSPAKNDDTFLILPTREDSKKP